MGTCSFENSIAHMTLEMRSSLPKLSHLFAVPKLYLGKFQNNSPFSSGGRLGFIEFQDSKLTEKKNEDFHKRDAVIFFFKGS